MKFLFAVCLFIACSLFAQQQKKLGYGDFEVHCLGGDTPEHIAELRAVPRRRVKLGVVSWSGVQESVLENMVRNAGGTLAFGNGSSESCRNDHDNCQLYEVLLVAEKLGVKLDIRIWQIAGNMDAAACFDAAGAESDVVLCYSSFWDRSVPQMTEAIRRHPLVLYLLPYGEIGNCPPTSTALQGHAGHPDGGGLTNLLTAIPMAWNCAGTLLTPSARDEMDGETVSLVTGSRYAQSYGVTCPATGVAAVAAAYVIACEERKPTACQVADFLTKASVFPGSLLEVLEGFPPEAISKLRTEFERLNTPDKVGIRRAKVCGSVNLFRYLEQRRGRERRSRRVRARIFRSRR